MKISASFAGRANKADCEALVVRHGHKRRFAVTRQAFNPNLFCIHFLGGFKIIESSAGAPGPRAQSAPIIGCAGLAMVTEADDSFSQAGAVISLNSTGNQDRVAPAFGEDLLLPCWPSSAKTVTGAGPIRSADTCEVATGEAICAAGSIGQSASAKSPSEIPKTELHHHGHGTGCLGRSAQRELDINCDCWIG